MTIVRTIAFVKGVNQTLFNKFKQLLLKKKTQYIIEKFPIFQRKKSFAAVFVVSTSKTNSKNFLNNQVNWLILPVIIFLDQRLSHACPRLNKLSVNLRMAHYKTVHPPENTLQLDNRCNSRANHA